MTNKSLRDGTGVADSTGVATASKNEKAASFTPGPWLASNRVALTHNHPTRYWERHINAASDLAYVGTGIGATEEEARANASIQAAAPDLLAALKAAEQFIHPEVQRGPASNGWQNTIDIVAAAIAKAEGRQ